MTTNETLRGTSAHAPDLNWSQVRETVLLLELASAQIESAMKDSNTSVDVLTESFTSMAGTMRMMTETLAAMPAEGGDVETRQSLLGAADHVSSMVHQAIIAFQFYDKLVQRLGHVTHSLGDLSTLVGDQRRLFNPQEWVDLQGRIRAKYTTADECTMFEAVISDTPVAEAVANYVDAMKNKQSDDIELF